MPVTDRELVPPEPPSGARAMRGPASARYEVVRVIGEGGMGVVYEAIDKERRERVALKTLRSFDPDALYRFKNEFRTLADLRHGNLVRLHELVMTDAEQVFFTMELVHGSDFRAYVTRPEIEEARARRGQRSSSAPPTQPTRSVEPVSARPQASVPLRGGESPADLGRLRAALLGLAEGLHALHAAGKLHRDIKPSNILVTEEGRVVLLDFGVATELAGLREEAREVEMVGTAAYMAPEQAAGEPPTPASDWYSVGVVLYEALVGRPPFVGSTFEVMQRKNLLDAEPPSGWVTGVPDDLEALCRAMLQREPEMRPHGTAILRQLRASRNSGTPQSLRPSFAGPDGAFVGREAQLTLLRDAFDAACAGGSITVRVGGASGMGKSTLVQHFLDQLSGSGRALVLRGRAYERETVPYKAFDSVVDALSRYLMRASEEDDALELPEDLAALARLFPVLRRVPSLAAAAEGPLDNLLEIRRRAFRGMRAMLGVLARRRPVVVYIDDVQWGDTDSAALLIELVRPPDAPPVLLVMTYRDNEERASPFLAETRALWPAGAEVREIWVGPLDPPDAERLALTLFEGPDDVGPRVARAAARESRGSPFLIGELVRSNLSASTPGTSTLTVLTVDQMVGERLDRLPAEAQRWLEIVAVGGRPLPIALVADAAGIYENVQAVVERAAAGRFVRTGLRGGHETVEMGHDRIREAIVARLSPATLKAHHERLSRVLEATPGADLEALAVHLRGADQPARAAAFAERAAEQAAAKIAFDQAVRLYRMALEMVPESSADAQRLRTRLAQVLEWSGRGAAAATVYLSAAEQAPGMQRVELERSAAEQLLATGRIDEGMAVLDRALAFVGMGRPRSALVAILWLLFYRLCLRVRGFRVEERTADDVARMARARIDTLYAVGVGLSFVDTLQAACMQARHLLLALRFGDRFQVLRAAALENATLASAGGEPGKPERALAELVERLARGADDPEGLAFALGTKGVALFLRGRWRDALESQDVAYTRYPNNRAGWHANGQLFAIWSLTFLGRLEEFRRRHARLLVDAEERGDLYTTVNLRIGYSNLAWLVVDDVESARRHVHEAMSVWSVQGYLLQHYRAMVADANIELYDGAGAKAYERVVRDETRLKKSFLLRVQYVRADARFVRAKSALAAAADAPDGASLVAEAEALARRLAGEHMAWTDLFASIVLAGVALAKANHGEAARLLRVALGQAEAAEMAMYAAAIRRQLGLLVGGDEGRELVAGGEAAMAAEGVHVPERFARMLVPGRWLADRPHVA